MDPELLVISALYSLGFFSDHRFRDMAADKEFTEADRYSPACIIPAWQKAG
jgi:hypothetical protein